MLENLLRTRRRYRAMLEALSGHNPVDLSLRRDLEATIAQIDAKLSAGSWGNKAPISTPDQPSDAAPHIKVRA